MKIWASYLPRAVAMAFLVTLGGCTLGHAPNGQFMAPIDTPYTLESGDKLRVIVYGQDTLSNTYTIDGKGLMTMPLLGEISARNRTTQNLEAEIEQRLASTYIRNPRVSVEMDTFRPFYIMGEVTTPGKYPFVNGTNAQMAVAIAGGFTPRAYEKKVEITRRINGMPVTLFVPYYTPIRPGDTIMIKERFL